MDARKPSGPGAHAEHADMRRAAENAMSVARADGANRGGTGLRLRVNSDRSHACRGDARSANAFAMDARESFGPRARAEHADVRCAAEHAVPITGADGPQRGRTSLGLGVDTDGADARARDPRPPRAFALYPENPLGPAL